MATVFPQDIPSCGGPAGFCTAACYLLSSRPEVWTSLQGQRKGELYTFQGLLPVCCCTSPFLDEKGHIVISWSFPGGRPTNGRAWRGRWAASRARARHACACAQAAAAHALLTRPPWSGRPSRVCANPHHALHELLPYSLAARLCIIAALLHVDRGRQRLPSVVHRFEWGPQAMRWCCTRVLTCNAWLAHALHE